MNFVVASIRPFAAIGIASIIMNKKQTLHLQTLHSFMLAARIYLLFASLVLGGCASNYNPKDPLEPLNRGIYKFNDTVDKAIAKPVAKAYKAVIPDPAKDMVRNFFSNLDDVVVMANNLLQLKFAQAASDSSRIVFNSTFGIFGLFNFASHLEKHNEDFGQTLGYWGMGSGPYIVLPFFGPSTVRDSAGLYADSQLGMIPRIDHIPTRNQAYLTEVISHRAGLLDQESVLNEAAAIDRYAFIRDAYLQRRLNLVHDGDPPREKFHDDEGDDKLSDNDSAQGAQPESDIAPVTTPVKQFRVWLPSRSQSNLIH